MHKLLSPPTELQTVADLLRSLGDIPPERIRFQPMPGTAKLNDVIEAERKGHLCELIDGVLVEKTMGLTESILTVELITILGNFVKLHKLGYIAGPDGTLKILPDQVRIPDVCFISWERLPSRKLPAKPIPHLVPDLAIEVLSANNTKKEMERKRREYFKAGVVEVWMVDGKKQEIRVYTSARSSKLYRCEDSISGGDLLPGFELKLAELFASRDPHE